MSRGIKLICVDGCKVLLREEIGEERQCCKINGWTTDQHQRPRPRPFFGSNISLADFGDLRIQLLYR